MKRIKSKILIIFILFNIIFFSILPLKSKAIDDLNFTFDDNILFDSDISNYNQSFNLRNQREYTEIYNGTYSFTNDSVGSLPEGWIKSGVILAEVINDFEGHNKVLNISAQTALVNIHNNIALQTGNLSIEFWIFRPDLIGQMVFTLVGTGGSNNIFFNNGGGVVWWRSDGNFPTLITLIAEKWYHFRIEFNIDFSNDSLSVWVNGINVLLNGITHDDLTNVNQIRLARGNANFNLYIDAIGYSFGENFDFEGDLIGSEPLHWNVQSFGTGIGTIERFQESNVFKIFDDSIHESVDVSTSFTQSSNQSIEYYIAINDTSLTPAYNMIFTEGGSGRISLKINNNDLYNHNGSDFLSVKDDFIIENTWFKITIVLHDYTNTFDIYINNILEGNNLKYSTNTTVSIDGLVFTSDGVLQITTYLDNFDINSTNYKNYYTGLNFIPYINISQTLQEVDKYEFALSGFNTLQVIGSSSYGTWLESDIGGGEVQIKEHPTDSNNRVVEIDTFSIADVKGLVKNNFSLTGTFIDISIEFEIIRMTGSTSYNIIAIESSDFNTIVGFIMWHNGSLGWFPDITSAGVPLRDDLTTGKVYNLQVLLNYELDIFILDWYIDGVFNESYIRPLIAIGKSGLKEIFIRSHWVDDQATMELYSVGVYENGLTDSKEIGWNVVDLQVSDWNPQTYNLFNIFGNGVMSMGIISGNYSVGENISGFVNPFNLNNELLTLNFYELPFFNLSNPSIVFSITTGNFSTSHLKIDGVKLLEGINEYLLIFESTNVDIDEGYFYVIGSKLFLYHVSDDTNLESIQARFNIDDLSSEGFLISFRSNIDNNARGFFRVNFTTTSNIIQIPIIETTTRFILTQNRTIRDLVILITDNDINSISGLTEGFIHLIKLQQVENLLISVITTSLIAMMIPILIILVPTLAVSQAYGKNLIIPMFIFISLILTITGIIPLWLFFVIAISNSVFIIKKKDGLI